MFNSYEFTFAGESSELYGLMVYEIGGEGQSDVSFGNKASIMEVRTTRRVKPIHMGVNYHSEPLEFSLVFGAQKPIDRYDMELVTMWLTGHQDYQWLSIGQPDLAHVKFRCLITELTPISHGWLPVAFKATVRCDCPYAYGYQFSKVYRCDDTLSVMFKNTGSAQEYIKPVLHIVVDPGVETISIVNHNDNDRTFEIAGLPAAGADIIVDNESCIITESTSGYNLYEGFNMNFFRLTPGMNNLEITGACDLEISGRLLYNVGG